MMGFVSLLVPNVVSTSLTTPGAATGFLLGVPALADRGVARGVLGVPAPPSSDRLPVGVSPPRRERGVVASGDRGARGVEL